MSDTQKEVAKEVNENETVSIQFVRNCCMFVAGASTDDTDLKTKGGRPVQVTFGKGSVHALTRKELKQIRLLDLVKSRDIVASSNPLLYVMLGQ